MNTFASYENNNGLCFCVFQSVGLNHTCVFWDSSKEGGSWSPRGCTVERSSTNRTLCSCNHLSSFAVLMSLYEMEVRAEPWPHSWDAAVCFVLLLFFPDLQCDSSLWTGQVWLAADDLGGSVPLAGLPLPLHPDVLHDPLHQESEDNNPPAPFHQPLCGHPHLPHVHLSHREQGKMPLRPAAARWAHWVLEFFPTPGEFSEKTLSAAAEWFMWVLRIINNSVSFLFLLFLLSLSTPFLPPSLSLVH